jgi:hypothetical protein
MSQNTIQKHKGKTMAKILNASLLMLIMVFGLSCSREETLALSTELLFNYPSDNPLEQISEDFLGKAGVDVDLSFWNDDEEKGWIKESCDCDEECDCSCECAE